MKSRRLLKLNIKKIVIPVRREPRTVGEMASPIRDFFLFDELKIFCYTNYNKCIIWYIDNYMIGFHINIYGDLGQIPPKGYSKFELYPAKFEL